MIAGISSRAIVRTRIVSRRPKVLRSPNIRSATPIYGLNYSSTRTISNGNHKNKHYHVDKWSECWKCGEHLSSDTLFCSVPKCGAVQALETSNVNLFETFRLPTGYKVDLAKLERAYKGLQKVLHPDKFATRTLAEKQKSTISSSAVNYAYEVRQLFVRLSV